MRLLLNCKPVLGCGQKGIYLKLSNNGQPVRTQGSARIIPIESSVFQQEGQKSLHPRGDPVQTNPLCLFLCAGSDENYTT